ncbi:hypothetical protein AALA00_09950 [Lachnospiraceae bacterium 46-15]
MVKRMKESVSAECKKQGSSGEHEEKADRDARLFKRYALISNGAYALAVVLVVGSALMRVSSESLRVIVWIAFGIVLVGMIASALAGNHNGSMESRFTTGAGTAREIEKKYKAHLKAEKKLLEKGLLEEPVLTREISVEARPVSALETEKQEDSTEEEPVSD